MTTLALKRSKVAFTQVGVDEQRDGVAALVDAATDLGGAVAAALPPTRSDHGATVVSPWSLLQLLMILRSGADGDRPAFFGQSVVPAAGEDHFVDVGLPVVLGPPVGVMHLRPIAGDGAAWFGAATVAGVEHDPLPH